MEYTVLKCLSVKLVLQSQSLFTPQISPCPVSEGQPCFGAVVSLAWACLCAKVNSSQSNMAVLNSLPLILNEKNRCVQWKNKIKARCAKYWLLFSVIWMSIIPNPFFIMPICFFFYGRLHWRVSWFSGRFAERPLWLYLIWIMNVNFMVQKDDSEKWHYGLGPKPSDIHGKFLKLRWWVSVVSKTA